MGIGESSTENYFIISGLRKRGVFTGAADENGLAKLNLASISGLPVSRVD